MKKVDLYFKTSFLSMLALIIFFTTLNTASSHPSGVTCSGGSELLGWVNKCDNHQSNNSFTFSISGLDLAYSEYALDGAKKMGWNC